MANHASAEKRIRQTEKRTARNKHIRTTVRTFLKRAREALTLEAVREAESRIRKAVSKGVIHRRTGSRLVSRLARAANGAGSTA